MSRNAMESNKQSANISTQWSLCSNCSVCFSGIKNMCNSNIKINNLVLSQHHLSSLVSSLLSAVVKNSNISPDSLFGIRVSSVLARPRSQWRLDRGDMSTSALSNIPETHYLYRTDQDPAFLSSISINVKLFLIQLFVLFSKTLHRDLLSNIVMYYTIIWYQHLGFPKYVHFNLY